MAASAASLGELVTAVAYDLPVTVVCLNNSRLGMLNSEQERLDMPLFFTELPPVNFARLAEACGVLGVRVSEPDALAGALHQAIAARRPTLVDVVTDPLERESTALQPQQAAIRA